MELLRQREAFWAARGLENIAMMVYKAMRSMCWLFSTVPPFYLPPFPPRQPLNLSEPLNLGTGHDKLRGEFICLCPGEALRGICRLEHLTKDNIYCPKWTGYTVVASTRVSSIHHLEWSPIPGSLCED